MSSEHQFQLLITLGLREEHRVLDIGCGSLGLGGLLVPFLRPRRYFGVDPQQGLIEDGVRFALGHDLFDRKQPQFSTSVDFGFRRFGVKFDYIVAHGLFPDIGAELVVACLRGAALCLEPDGVLVASFIPGPCDYDGAGWNPHAKGEYSVTKLKSMAHQAGLTLNVLDWPHPGGHSWVLLSLPGHRYNPVERPVAALPCIVAGNSGYVERVQDVGGYAVVEGWAIDPEKRVAAAQVLIVEGGGAVLASIPVNQPRPDVAAIHGDATMLSGFRGLVRTDRSGELSCYAVVSRGEAYRLVR
jgi:hypothetical protein